MQRLKLDTEAAMLELDQILRANVGGGVRGAVRLCARVCLCGAVQRHMSSEACGLKCCGLCSHSLAHLHVCSHTHACAQELSISLVAAVPALAISWGTLVTLYRFV